MAGGIALVVHRDDFDRSTCETAVGIDLIETGKVAIEQPCVIERRHTTQVERVSNPNRIIADTEVGCERHRWILDYGLLGSRSLGWILLAGLDRLHRCRGRARHTVATVCDGTVIGRTGTCDNHERNDQAQRSPVQSYSSPHVTSLASNLRAHRITPVALAEVARLGELVARCHFTNEVFFEQHVASRT